MHGQKNMYYQVNATYYSALGEDDRKMLLARAVLKANLATYEYEIEV